jgi:surface antigen
MAKKIAKDKAAAASKPSAAKPPSGNVQPPEVLSRATGKEAVKEGLKQGVKGGVKGAIQTKSPQGAAVAAGVGAAAGVADKINEAAAARKQAGTSQATRSSHGVLAGAGGGALDRGRTALENKYGASVAAKSNLPITKEQVVSIAKASNTLTQEVSRKAVKTAGIAIGTVIALVYALILTTVSATSGPIAAAISTYQVNAASCEAPTTVTAGDKGSEEGLKPAPVKALRYINATWGGEVEDVYGNRDGDALDHGTGNALDVMLADYTSPASNALGHEVANYFQSNAKAYGIKYIIFDNQIWANGANPTSSWTYNSTGQTYGPLEWAPYSILPGMPADDNQKHLNHVHMSFEDNPGDSSTATAASSTTLTSPEFERASSVQVLNNVPILTANLDEINANPATYGLSSNPTVRAEQLANAKTIMGVAKNIGFNEKGAIIGVMTSLTESNLVNVAYGDAAGPNSRGLFQQRTAEGGWGSVEDVMNPAYAAQAFFLGVNGKSNPGLDSVSGWQDMEPWVAAQAVQRSFDSAGGNYLKWHPAAETLVSVLYADSPPVPAVTSGKINPPKAGVNVQTSDNGCASSSGDGGNSATAAGDTYPARNEDYCRSLACYAIQSADRVANGYRGECVDWAGWKLLEGTGTYGTHVPISMGNATSWGDSARAKGIAVDMKPRAGDAVYWTSGQGGSGDAGHIGTVQSVSGNKVVIEEYNFAKSLPGDTPATGGGRYNTRTIDVNNASGYIHFIDPSKSKEENKEYLISKGILVPGKTNWPRAAG